MENGIFTRDNPLTLMCQGETFAVHQSIVCEQSRVLKAAFKDNNYKEGSTKTIEVNFDKETLQYMLNFMYRGTYRVFGPGDIEQHGTAKCNEGLLPKVADSEASTPSEASSVQDETICMFEMLRPHILVNCIADYYDVPKLKEQAKNNVRQILQHFWFADCIGAVVDFAFESTSDMGLLSLINAAVADHMLELIDRRDFVELPLLNQFSGGIIRELVKKLIAGQQQLMRTEQVVAGLEEYITCKNCRSRLLRVTECASCNGHIIHCSVRA